MANECEYSGSEIKFYSVSVLLTLASAYIHVCDRKSGLAYEFPMALSHKKEVLVTRDKQKSLSLM